MTAPFRFATSRLLSRTRARCPTATARAPAVSPTVERELTERHADAVAQFLRAGHQPGNRSSSAFTARPCCTRRSAADGADSATGALLARRTGVDVVYDLRAADVRGRRAGRAAGAGLSPRACRPAAASGRWRSSISAASPTSPGSARDGTLIAFDTGPGNALIDDWMHGRTGRAMDTDGALAASGKRR